MWRVLSLCVLLAACVANEEHGFFPDGDGDGSPTDADCNDGDADVHPGAIEACNRVDDDCDGRIDEEVTIALHADADGDGFGDPEVTEERCEPGDEWVVLGTDCDDEDASKNPLAVEACDAIDNDCDGSVDEGVTVSVYADADGDGFGVDSNVRETCDIAEGEAYEAGDCDDEDGDVTPSAVEWCDGVDNDCDGVIDEDTAADAGLWFADEDGDTYGDFEQSLLACVSPSGFVENSLDCDDQSETAHPGATEACDGVDNDCDARIDEDALDVETWRADEDGDGFGADVDLVLGCETPFDGWIMVGGDCDDSAEGVNPNATETCDDIDNDCDGSTDPSTSIGTTVSYADADGDGFGTALVVASACEPPVGYVADSLDCNDGEENVHPSAEELCDSVDNDCDGAIDEASAVDALVWFHDEDGDGYGNADTVVSCQKPSGTAASGGDCDEVRAAINPGATEICNGLDDDCSGAIDDDPSDGATYYADADGDGDGDPETPEARCSEGTGYVSNALDCDDTDAGLSNGTVWYEDADADGYGKATVFEVQCEPPDSTDVGYSLQSGDCNDESASAFPGLTEICYNAISGAIDTLDNNCDGVVNEPAACQAAIHCGTVSTSQTWTADQEHIVSCSVTVGGSAAPRVTIEAGAVVKFELNTRLLVGTASTGNISVAGTLDDPVLFTSVYNPGLAGDWGGLEIGKYAQTSTIEGIHLEYAGSSGRGALRLQDNKTPILDSEIRESSSVGIYLYNSSATAVTEPIIAGSVISDHASYGLYCGWETAAHGRRCLPAPTGTPLWGSFDDNVLTGNYAPARINVESVGAINASSDFTGNEYDHVYISGTSTTGTTATENVTSSLTMPALDAVRYVATTNLEVKNGATLTLSDGVTLAFSGYSLTVGKDTSNKGELVVDGTSEGVLLTSAREHPTRGDWTGLKLGAGTSAATRIQGLTVEYAGSSGGLQLAGVKTGITIEDSAFVDGSGPGIAMTGASVVGLRGVVASDNATYGLSMDGDSHLTVFDGNTMTGNGSYPLMIPPQTVAKLDALSALTGNDRDFIAIVSPGSSFGGRLKTTGTWSDLGLPYAVLGSFEVADATAPVLTLDPGVELLFASGKGLTVGESTKGDIVAVGTSDNRVVLAGLDRTGPGAWNGLELGANTGSTTVLSYVDLRDGGATNVAGLSVGGRARVTFARIEDNRAYGVRMDAGAQLSIEDSLVRGTVSSDPLAVYRDGSGVTAFTTCNYATWCDPGTVIVSWARNTVTENETFPVVTWGEMMRRFDTASTYVGNGDDRVLALGDYIGTTTTIAVLDVPWLFSSQMVITSGAVLTMNDATIEFAPGASLDVSDGELVAENSTFTSGQSVPAPGDWKGIAFSDGTAASQLDNCTIEYAGWAAFDYTPAYGAVTLKQDTTPLLTDLTIREIDGYGFECYAGHSWEAAYDGSSSLTDHAFTNISLGNVDPECL